MQTLLKDIVELFRAHRDIGYGLWGAAWGALFAWHQQERKREILWRAILTGGIGLVIDESMTVLGITSGHLIVLIVVSSVGADVVLEKTASRFGLAKRKRKEARD